MKRIFFLILLAVMSTGIYAQTDDKGYKEGAWVLNGVTGLNLSQTAMTNWSAGGENALSGNALPEWFVDSIKMETGYG